MAVPKPDFTKIFGSAKTDLTPVSDANYVQGWDYVGSTPPTKNDFTYLQNLADNRTIWLSENNFGRLLNTQTFTTNGIYTATAGTKKIRIRAVGGGGAGGSAGTNSSTTISVGSSGGSGGYGEAILTSGFDGQSVTIGNGGIANIGGTGGTGGNTLFGSLLAVGGGGGGAITQVSTSTIFNYSGQGASGGAMTGTGLVVAARGTVGSNGLAFGTAGLPLAAIGAASFFGGGSAQSAANIVGTDSVSYGSGGPGTATTTSNTAKLAGAGAKGVLIIEEYS